ncbi:MAG: hypothetical protein EON93_17000 [Burkholderiales bacterium]|nr:MAG: hypothetical protein EON93_17000 [Burkholderiales bacterium]
MDDTRAQVTDKPTLSGPISFLPERRESTPANPSQPRDDSVSRWAQQMQRPPGNEVPERQFEWLRSTLAEIGALRLRRNNRPGHFRLAQPDDDIGSTRKACAREYLAQRKALQTSDPVRFHALTHDARLQQRLYASAVNTVYGAGGRAAYCEENAAIQHHRLLQHGMPASEIVPLSLAGQTRAGQPVLHNLLLVGPSTMPADRHFNADDIRQHVHGQLSRCVLSDPWSENKLVGFAAGASWQEFVEQLCVIMCGVDSDFDPSSLALCETTPGCRPQPLIPTSHG